MNTEAAKTASKPLYFGSCFLAQHSHYKVTDSVVAFTLYHPSEDEDENENEDAESTEHSIAYEPELTRESLHS